MQLPWSAARRPPPPALSVWGTNSAIPSHLLIRIFHHRARSRLQVPLPLSPASLPLSLASTFPSTPPNFHQIAREKLRTTSLQISRHHASFQNVFTPRSAGPTGPTRPKMKAMNGPTLSSAIDMPSLRLGDGTRYHDGQFQPLPRCTVTSLPRRSTVDITQRKDPTGIAAHPHRAVEETRVRFLPAHWTLARNKTAAP